MNIGDKELKEAVIKYTKVIKQVQSKRDRLLHQNQEIECRTKYQQNCIRIAAYAEILNACNGILKIRVTDKRKWGVKNSQETNKEKG